MNITNLTGRLTKDIELRTTQSGKTVANFTLAVNRRFKSHGQPDADFFRCQAWGKTAEVLHQYTHKGSQIGVTGRLQNRKAIFGCTRDQQLWEATYNGDKDETYIDRYQKFSNWVLKEVAND
ncbi:single-stranded DNA-binding protein [Faecalibaculum rodentium]|uniref:single-stranded DNA-binding protein n=1 Tax=Faecalibaculum rodentium TaxID=1702221 RepID=UPI0023F13E5F|nr:single-stranded DNA-binding protein [Faecalibaculum rodentium]